jgi:hypothetical protein
MAARTGRLREFADAAAPLYASLSDDQKRRAFLLINRAEGDMMGMGGGGFDDGMDDFGMRRRGRGMMGPGMMNWRG